MKRILILIMVMLPLAASAQFERAGLGLSFSSGVEYNFHETGNPGVWANTYFKIANRFHLVPSLTVFNPYKKTTVDESIKNYMFHGDLNAQYAIFKEGDLRVVGVAGLNATTVISRYENFLGLEGLPNISDVKLGLNLGGTIEMQVDDYWDAVLTGKYIAGPWSQFVVSIGVVYVFEGRMGRGWR
jgi:hypothetical protein